MKINTLLSHRCGARRGRARLVSPRRWCVDALRSGPDEHFDDHRNRERQRSGWTDIGNLRAGGCERGRDRPRQAQVHHAVERARPQDARGPQLHAAADHLDVHRQERDARALATAREFDVVKQDDTIATGTWSMVNGTGRYAGTKGGGSLVGIRQAARAPVPSPTTSIPSASRAASRRQDAYLTGRAVPPARSAQVEDVEPAYLRLEADLPHQLDAARDLRFGQVAVERLGVAPHGEEGGRGRSRTRAAR